MVCSVGFVYLFLSTLSLRRATISCARSASRLADFYPRSPCGERHINCRANHVKRYISIHALLAESDTKHDQATNTHRISIHALLAESDQTKTKANEDRYKFLSTLSLRRATDYMLYNTSSLIFLSTLSLRRATWPGLLARPFFIISIHALLAESD